MPEFPETRAPRPLPRIRDSDWVVGELLAHGEANYRFDELASRSYFVRLRKTSKAPAGVLKKRIVVTVGSMGARSADPGPRTMGACASFGGRTYGAPLQNPNPR
jgi:hypothetical protein